MREVPCPGLDGRSLLGFLGGLGALEALQSTSQSDDPIPQLRWAAPGSLHAILKGVDSTELLATRILADARSAHVNDLLSFKYVKREQSGPRITQSLSPPVAVLRAALFDRIRAGRAAVADALGALICETATEEVAEAKQLSAAELQEAGVDWDHDLPLNIAASPTPFDFTSRTVQFLDQIRRIRDSLTEDAVVRDLRLAEGTPVDRIMRWDALVDMPGALFDRAKPMTRPVAEWLAFRGITYFPLSENRGRAVMYGLVGRRKAGEFTWVLWNTALSRQVIKSTLAMRWNSLSPAERAARGVCAGFTVELRKDATGYDGAVSPSKPVG